MKSGAGYVEDISPYHVGGWSADTAGFVELWLDGTKLGTAAVDLPRPDVSQAGLGIGPHGWKHEFQGPITWEQIDRVKVRAFGETGGSELPWSGALVAQRQRQKSLAGGILPAGRKVFIVGPPRTGTSSLAVALIGYLGVPQVGESHIVPLFQSLASEAQRYLLELRQHVTLVTERVDENAIHAALVALMRSTYWSIFPAGSWVDKTPSAPSLHGVDLILEAFPDARIIVTKRHGVEMVSSFVKKFGSTVEEASQCWSAAARMTIKLMERGDVLLVDTDELRNDETALARRLLDFLGIGENEELLRQHLMHRIESSRPHSDSIRDFHGVGWSDGEILAFKQECGQLMEALGYWK